MGLGEGADVRGETGEGGPGGSSGTATKVVGDLEVGARYMEKDARRNNWGTLVSVAEGGVWLEGGSRGRRFLARERFQKRWKKF